MRQWLTFISWVSYQIRNIAGCACARNTGNVFPAFFHRLQRKPPVSDPGMHHGTCVTHVPWCMSGTRGDGEKCFQQFRRMRNPQFYTSGKRPMGHRHSGYICYATNNDSRLTHWDRPFYSYLINGVNKKEFKAFISLLSFINAISVMSHRF